MNANLFYIKYFASLHLKVESITKRERSVHVHDLSPVAHRVCADPKALRPTLIPPGNRAPTVAMGKYAYLVPPKDLQAWKCPEARC
jgi:hypothetical protein